MGKYTTYTLMSDYVVFQNRKGEKWKSKLSFSLFYTNPLW